MLIIFNIKEMKSCCCSCPCSDECPCKSPCDCSKCIWEIKNESKKDGTTYDYLQYGLLLRLKAIRSNGGVRDSEYIREN